MHVRCTYRCCQYSPTVTYLCRRWPRRLHYLKAIRNTLPCFSEQNMILVRQTTAQYSACAMTISYPTCTCIVLSTVDRKIQDNEFPHQLYVQNYSSKGGASDSCILLKKWIFSRTHEVQASTDSVVRNLFYHQVSMHTACAGWGLHTFSLMLCIQ